MNRQITKTVAALILVAMSFVACGEEKKNENPVKKPDTGEYESKRYSNPVIRNNCADPSVIDNRERDGYFYAYSTQNGESGTAGVVYLPVYRSKDMVSWSLVGNAFGTDRPQWVTNTRVWAPDINYINGQYVLYYSLGDWSTPSRSSVGVAVSDSPTGPFQDRGMLVDYESHGVTNSIDANYVEDGDKKYLFWGSYGAGSGIWVVELASDGLYLKPGTVKKKVAGNQMEGTYVYKKGKYWYLFASMGSCCDGASSTYHIVVGRSDDVLGPYTDPKGGSMINDAYSNTILEGYGDFAGTGHNAEILTDDKGNDWMFYHSYWKGNKYNGRCLCMDQVIWVNDWPTFRSGHPSTSANGPSFKKQSE